MLRNVFLLLYYSLLLVSGDATFECVLTTKWLPKSLDINPLHCHVWNKG
jgi:hypothetical protein